MTILVTLCELAFPTRCAGCGAYSGRQICASCNASLPLVRGEACRRCGKPVQRAVDDCPQCGGWPGHVDATAALGTYEEPLRTVIHKLKYGNGWRLAAPLGAMAAVRLAPLLGGGSPLVTHVPMHRRKKRARGYDHAELLAREIAAALGLDLVRALERTRPTRSQQELGQAERRENVKGAFAASGDGVGGREVVLVDDVLTTGSTISECARALKQAGAVRITACVLARDMTRAR